MRGSFSRRAFLATGVTVLGLRAARRSSGFTRQSVSGARLFSLGVASGDPMPDSVVLWTRLAPDPLNGGGMPDDNVAVNWEVARDEQFAQVVREGTETATSLTGHAVHAVVEGLDPGRWYWYRFHVGMEESRVGGPGPCPRRAPAWIVSDSRSPRVSTGSEATSRPTTT